MTIFKLLMMLLLIAGMQKERQAERDEMVRTQIEARGIRHQPVLNAMRRVERHKLVPESQRANAYADYPLPIGYGQTISQPYIVAYMTEIIQPEEHHRVLEIGTGSGYQAAVLAQIVSEVYTVEIIRELSEKARKDLKALGYNNIYFKSGDGFFGWSEHAPFDAIVVTAASEIIPPPLIEQLKDGGKMIIPVGSPFLTQQLILVEKREGKVTTKSLIPVRFVPLTRQ